MDAPTTKTKTKKKGKTHRKWGRNKRKPGATNQKSRTTQNKHNRLNYERKKAGLPPVGPAAAERLLAARRITD